MSSTPGAEDVPQTNQDTNAQAQDATQNNQGTIVTQQPVSYVTS